MFALPSEFRLTKDQAGRILFECYKSGKFTFHQMRTIKKTLSYAYQLQGGIPGKNYETIPGVWLVVQEEQLKPQEHFCLPTRIPLPRELRKAFTTEYREECGWSFMNWNRGLIRNREVTLFLLKEYFLNGFTYLKCTLLVSCFVDFPHLVHK